jgi:hypothetical protein
VKTRIFPELGIELIVNNRGPVYEYDDGFDFQICCLTNLVVLVIVVLYCTDVSDLFTYI